MPPTVSSISVRFGDPILQAGFTAVPNLILDYYAELGISLPEMMFSIHVWQYWWTKDLPYPSLQQIAPKMGIERRQISRHVESLKKKGYLKVTERQLPGQGQVASEYDFSPLLQAVLQLALRDQGNGAGTPLSKMTRGDVRNDKGPLVRNDYRRRRREEEGFRGQKTRKRTRPSYGLGADSGSSPGSDVSSKL